MTPILPTARAALALAACTALAACARNAIDANVAAARADVQARAGVDFQWRVDAAARAQARADVATVLAHPIAQDDAVRVALDASPAFQALLFERAAESARTTQSGRLPNPVFEFERVVGGAPVQVEVTRALTLSLVDLLLWPARAGAADARQQALRLQLAADALRQADVARAAWVDAVAAAQALRQAERVRDAADAGAELARRMEAAGNFSALQRAREEAWSGDAAVDLADARHGARATREALARALGLDDAQAATLMLPDRLPALPATAPSADTPVAIDARLDVQLAQARLAEVARREGLARADVLDGLALGPAARAETGLPREHGLTLAAPLPVFDTGDAARAGAAAAVQAQQRRVAALAIAAASQLREARGELADRYALAHDLQTHLVPLHATIVDENLLRYNGMLASTFDLLADARAQAHAVQQSIAAQRAYWLADAAWTRARLGVPQDDAAVAIDAEAAR